MTTLHLNEAVTESHVFFTMQIAKIKLAKKALLELIFPLSIDKFTIYKNN